jgi:hypothetical protein
MVTVYPKQYFDEFDIIEKSFSYPKNPNAKQDRDQMARELRKQGWTVKSKTTHFHGDLCYGDLYSLSAERRKRPGRQQGEVEPAYVSGNE